MNNLARNLAEAPQPAEAGKEAPGTEAEIPVFMEMFTTLANPKMIQMAAHEFLAHGRHIDDRVGRKPERTPAEPTGREIEPWDQIALHHIRSRLEGG